MNGLLDQWIIGLLDYWITGLMEAGSTERGWNSELMDYGLFGRMDSKEVLWNIPREGT